MRPGVWDLQDALHQPPSLLPLFLKEEEDCLNSEKGGGWGEGVFCLLQNFGNLKFLLFFW